MQSNLLSRASGLIGLARTAKTYKGAVDDASRDSARSHLVQRMGKLRGLPQKLGQILSMNCDESEAFDCLTDHAEPLPLEVIASVLEERWGKPLEEVLRDIAPEGLAASLGQVHRATLLDGRDVAIKVRYPGIVKAVKNDTRMLGGLSYLVGDLRRGFDLGDYRKEVLRDVEEELDYLQEARNQTDYSVLERAVPGWRIPKVIGDLSGEDVLVSTWQEGVSIAEVSTWAEEERGQLAKLMLKGFFEMLFGQGLLHADPHPGNYRFVRGNRDGEPGVKGMSGEATVVLLDFGSVIRVSVPERVALLKLIGVTREASGDPLRPLLALGFSRDFLEPIHGKLPGLFRVLLEPFVTQGAYAFEDWNRAERIDDVLGDDRWNFRMSGPANLMLMMRAFHGLVYYMDKLGVDVPWAFHLQRYEQASSQALTAFDVSPVGDGQGAMDRLAKKLCLRVISEGETKVELSFPSARVDHLRDFIDEELMVRLEAKGVDIDAVVKTARKNGYAPCELFELGESLSSRGVRIWLE